MNLRVLFFITGLNRGGAEWQLYRIACLLHKRCWKVRIITLLKKSGYSELLEREGIEVFSLEMDRGKASLYKLISAVKLTRSYKPHVVIGFMFHANIVARMAAKLSRVPVIITSIRTEKYKLKRRNIVEYFLSKICDAVVVNSKRTAQNFISKGIIKKEKIRIIPNGIEVVRCVFCTERSSDIKNKYGIEENDFLWIAIGNLVEEKDYTNLLNAFRIVRNKKKTKLLIAGEGDMRNKLERLRDILGLLEDVNFMGYFENIHELISISDAYVLSSSQEGMPNSLMEAMCLGKPVVATNVGGVVELIRDEESGYIVEKKKPEELARAMIRMMEISEAERIEMGQKGKNYIISNFNMSRVVRLWEDLILELYDKKIIQNN